MACTNVFHTTKHNVKYYRIFAKQLFWCYNVDIPALIPYFSSEVGYMSHRTELRKHS